MSSEILKKLAPDLSDAHIRLISGYRDQLLKFNRKLNLISRNTEENVDEIHLLDSVLAVKLLPECDPGTNIHDIGSGNGLPGVILAILRPQIQVTAVDSDSRKCEFIKHVGSYLKLSNLSVTCSRAEGVRGMDIAVNRGFASIARACEICTDGFTVGSQFFHLKGAGWSEELADFSAKLGAHWAGMVVGEYSLPSSQAQRALVCTTRTS